MNFLFLRADSHAQYEIRVYAETMLDTVKKWVPITHAAFLDYREELSDGAVLAGVRHSQRVFDLRFNKKNLVKIKNKPVHLKIGYAEGVNLRGTKTIKFESEITDKVGFNLKYVDNMGKGPIGSTNKDQNRNYLVSEIAYKF